MSNSNIYLTHKKLLDCQRKRVKPYEHNIKISLIPSFTLKGEVHPNRSHN